MNNSLYNVRQNFYRKYYEIAMHPILKSWKYLLNIITSNVIDCIVLCDCPKIYIPLNQIITFWWNHIQAN